MIFFGSSEGFLILVFFLLNSSGVEAFIFQNNEVSSNAVSSNPTILQQLQRNHSGNKMQIQLLLENPQDRAAQLALNGLELELTFQPFDDTKDSSMPKDDSKTTSGMRALNVLNEASFVDIHGQQNVAMTDGCWELTFTPDGLAGNLICGLTVPNEVSWSFCLSECGIR
jgi:hypothetical protein